MKRIARMENSAASCATGKITLPSPKRVKTLRTRLLSLLACVHVLAGRAISCCSMAHHRQEKVLSRKPWWRVPGSNTRVSFDDFLHSYRLKREHPESFLTSLYRHAKEQSEAGKNIVIDTVEFDRDYDNVLRHLGCRTWSSGGLLPASRIFSTHHRRNISADPSNHRAF